MNHQLSQQTDASTCFFLVLSRSSYFVGHMSDWCRLCTILLKVSHRISNHPWDEGLRTELLTARVHLQNFGIHSVDNFLMKPLFLALYRKTPTQKSSEKIVVVNGRLKDICITIVQKNKMDEHLKLNKK